MVGRVDCEARTVVFQCKSIHLLSQPGLFTTSPLVYWKVVDYNVWLIYFVIEHA